MLHNLTNKQVEDASMKIKKCTYVPVLAKLSIGTERKSKKTKQTSTCFRDKFK